jgi:uncharacterized cupredoxin-like copper-binding protein
MLLLAACVSASVMAAGDLTSQDPVEVTVQLGDEKNALRFVPDRLELETGKLYKLVLHNESPQKHYFSSDSFSRAVFTRKVQVRDKEGTSIAEVKGTIREIEVYPGQKAEWWLVPVKSGIFDDLKCTIKGHAEHGMVGSIVVR